MRKITPESPKEMYGEMPMNSDAKVLYPTICFDTNTLPEAKDWKVGTTYKLALEITMTGTSQRKGRDGKETGHFDFDVVGIEPGDAVKAGKPNRYA